MGRFRVVKQLSNLMSAWGDGKANRRAAGSQSFGTRHVRVEDLGFRL